jgi:hypothetical protein
MLAACLWDYWNGRGAPDFWSFAAERRIAVYLAILRGLSAPPRVSPSGVRASIVT